MIHLCFGGKNKIITSMRSSSFCIISVIVWLTESKNVKENILKWTAQLLKFNEGLFYVGYDMGIPVQSFRKNAKVNYIKSGKRKFANFEFFRNFGGGGGM